jgi:hypothetical protein
VGPAIGGHGALLRYGRRSDFQDEADRGWQRSARHEYRKAVSRYPSLNAQCDPIAQLPRPSTLIPQVPAQFNFPVFAIDDQGRDNTPHSLRQTLKPHAESGEDGVRESGEGLNSVAAPGIDASNGDQPGFVGKAMLDAIAKHAW